MAGGKKSKNDRDRKRKKGGGRDSSVARQVRPFIWVRPTCLFKLSITVSRGEMNSKHWNSELLLVRYSDGR